MKNSKSQKTNIKQYQNSNKQNTKQKFRTLEINI